MSLGTTKPTLAPHKGFVPPAPGYGCPTLSIFLGLCGTRATVAPLPVPASPTQLLPSRTEGTKERNWQQKKTQPSLQGWSTDPEPASLRREAPTVLLTGQSWICFPSVVSKEQWRTKEGGKKGQTRTAPNGEATLPVWLQ